MHSPHFILSGVKRSCAFYPSNVTAELLWAVPTLLLSPQIPFSQPAPSASSRFSPEDQRKHQMRAVLRLILQKFRVWAAEFLAEQIKTNLKASQKRQGERGWKCIIQASWKGWDPISGHWDRKICLKLKRYFLKRRLELIPMFRWLFKAENVLTQRGFSKWLN